MGFVSFYFYLQLITFECKLHYVKGVRFRSFSGSYFPAFGLNTETCGVSLHIQSKCGIIRTRKTPNTDTFHASQFDSLKLCITGEIKMSFNLSLQSQAVFLIKIVLPKWLIFCFHAFFLNFCCFYFLRAQ